MFWNWLSNSKALTSFVSLLIGLYWPKIVEHKTDLRLDLILPLVNIFMIKLNPCKIMIVHIK